MSRSLEEWAGAYVGGPPLLTGPVRVVDYDPQWPLLFGREEQRIRAVLGDTVISVAHVGSTSVPGLAAKPVIDIDLIVPSSADEDSYAPQLAASGYRLVIREPDWHEHRCLKGPDTDINLHVFSPGSPEVVRHQIFRDWLRAHPEDRELYGRMKKDVATRGWRFIQEYNNAKEPVIHEIYARAFAALGSPSSPRHP
ncbi:MAG: GrpB family protein [Actinobacteria bacterium]|nr:GrpB family protein [Actinomycetota bacterium]